MGGAEVSILMPPKLLEIDEESKEEDRLFNADSATGPLFNLKACDMPVLKQHTIIKQRNPSTFSRNLQNLKAAKSSTQKSKNGESSLLLSNLNSLQKQTGTQASKPKLIKGMTTNVSPKKTQPPRIPIASTAPNQSIRVSQERIFPLSPSQNTQVLYTEQRRPGYPQDYSTLNANDDSYMTLRYYDQSIQPQYIENNQYQRFAQTQKSSYLQSVPNLRYPDRYDQVTPSPQAFYTNSPQYVEMMQPPHQARMPLQRQPTPTEYALYGLAGGQHPNIQLRASPKYAQQKQWNNNYQ
ncbi:hypothetical protein FGO68_gene3386 [Halteria grandinella]|uniref:Uncharacterized protein n=1 Tax=Halteria grandinella TaxID=5974 RepID=A0A8J8T5G1_HALGN|nr:hypothetical protein FGO68_gene3386 [Halteria grandinella]